VKRRSCESILRKKVVIQKCELGGQLVEGRGTEEVEGGHLVQMWNEEVRMNTVGRWRAEEISSREGSLW